MSGGRGYCICVHQLRIRLLVLVGFQAHGALPSHFKGPCQRALGEMRGGGRATQRSVMGRGHRAPSGPHRVILAGDAVMQR